MSTVRQHSCIGRELVAQGIEDPPAAKCRCRQSISKEKAKKKVDEGEARFVVLSRKYEQVEVPCPLCHADPEFKNCPNCNGTGRVEIDNVREQLGDDIVLVSRAAKDKKERKYRPALAMKTPRVATIESEHCELAYSGSVETKTVNGKKVRVWVNLEAKAKAAQDRIEEYGRLILDARMFVGKDRIPAIGVEPEDDPKKGTGRDCDYGRAI
jgi:hypothetical protein